MSHLGIIGPDHTWQERRSLALALAFNAEVLQPDLPDRGPCIGHVFMRPTRIHFPGWPHAVVLDGLVPKSVGGVAGTVPSWDSLRQHFARREKKQNREKLT